MEQLKKNASISVEISVDHVPPKLSPKSKTHWQGHVGFVSTLLPHKLADPENTVAMICGPEIMMRACMSELRALNLKDSQIFLSLERNMKCAIGHCGHCQFMPFFICKEGPVLSLERIRPFFGIKEL